MARVSQEHLDARRRQILDGAALCFARNGFHATSMQDVLKEVDLSAGAVYRYFSGKEELIGAIVTEVLETVGEVFNGAVQETPPPLPDVLMPRVLAGMRERRPLLLEGGEWMFPRLMVQVWTETLRNEQLAALLAPGFERILEAWREVAESYRRAGLLAKDADADALARVMVAMVQGFAVQTALFGDVPQETLRAGLRALMGVGGSQLG
ncbi:TetR/AcrR family transcriptional regulator [Streptomyces sp. NPDC058739]|uniref:TetR/AcrR family transcriptional regulator n=1 Tax=Streptomyces sp. NPDC058739 TaxID=3346618 RepID=UPI0036BBFFE0